MTRTPAPPRNRPPAAKKIVKEKRLNATIEYVDRERGERRVVILPTETPWLRIDGEPDAAYGYFQQYIKSGGRGQRPNLAVFAQQMGVSKTTINTYSSNWQWRVRAEAYDTHFEKLQQKADEDAKLRVQNRALRIAEKGLDALENLLPEIIERVKKDAEPGAVDLAEREGIGQVEIFVKVNMSIIKDWANAVAVLNKEARTSVGLPNTISSSSVKIGADTESFEDVLKQLEERRKLAAGGGNLLNG